MSEPSVVKSMTARAPQRDHKKGQHLNDGDKLFVLWGIMQRWSKPYIAARLPCGISTLQVYRRRIFAHPEEVFELSVYEMRTEKKFVCGFCNEIRNTEMKIRRHVLSHVLPYERARDVDLNGVKRRL